MPDFTGINNADLGSQLAALDQKFPPGVRHDRRFTPQDFMLQGPWPSEGQPRLLRNPLTGGTIELQPGLSPEFFVHAANALVEAKARARADVIRGRDMDEATTEAMASALGLDPGSFRGMPPNVARSVMPTIAGRQEDAEKQRRSDQDVTSRRFDEQQAFQRMNPEAAGQVANVRDPEDARGVFGTALRLLEEQGKQRATQRQAELEAENSGKLAGEVSRLGQMDPEEALRVGPTALGAFAEPGKPAYNALVGDLEQRAVASMKQRQFDQKERLAGQKQQRVDERKSRQDRKKRVLDPLDDVLSSTPTFKLGKSTPEHPEGVMEGDYLNKAAQDITALRRAINAVDEEIPGAAELFVELDEIENSLGTGDPKEASKRVREMAADLKRRYLARAAAAGA